MSKLVLPEISNPDGLQLIGSDIDDVIKHFKRDFVPYYNQKYKLSHTERTIPGYIQLREVDGLDYPEEARRIRRSHDDGASSGFEPRADALEVLPRLTTPSTKLGFVAITATPDQYADITKKYLDTHFPGIFMGIIHTDLHSEDGGEVVQKYEICKMLGINMLIDDNPTNCELAAANGLLAICFGDHDWNLHVTTQPNLITLPDWYAVERFLTPRESYDSEA